MGRKKASLEPFGLDRASRTAFPSCFSFPIATSDGATVDPVALISSEPSSTPCPMALRTLLATVFVALASMVLCTAPAFAQVSVLPSPNASGNATSAQRSSPAPDTHPSPEARPLPTETSTYRASHEQLGAVSGVALAPVVEQRYVRLPLPSRPAPDSVSQGIRWGRFAGVTSTLAASYTGLFLFERAQWWDGEGSGFHFDSHLNYARADARGDPRRI